MEESKLYGDELAFELNEFRNSRRVWIHGEFNVIVARITGPFWSVQWTFDLSIKERKC